MARFETQNGVGGGVPSPIPSPYNFVPLGDTVYLPRWTDQVSHDVPFMDGISGWFEVEVVATTPIYIRNSGVYERNPDGRLVRLPFESEVDYDCRLAAWKDFYRLHPGGPYAIPGTSLKGMLRSVLEIVTFGKMILTDREVAGAIANHHLVHREPEPNDMAEVVFGYVGGNRRPALRGRVQFEPLPVRVPRGEAPPQPLDEVDTVLSAPRVRHSAHYVEQATNPGTYQVAGGLRHISHNNAKVRGWKRYPAGKHGEDPAMAGIPPTPPNRRVATQFRPLPAGTRFRGRVHVHNLRPVEFGAFLWCLTFGNGAEPGRYRHSLGMGKPFGYGTCAVLPVFKSIVNLRTWGQHNMAFQPIASGADQDCKDTILNHVRKFETHMEAEVKGWKASKTLETLLAMADPAFAAPHPLRYPTFQEFRAIQANLVKEILPPFI